MSSDDDRKRAFVLEVWPNMRSFPKGYLNDKITKRNYYHALKTVRGYDNLTIIGAVQNILAKPQDFMPSVAEIVKQIESGNRPDPEEEAARIEQSEQDVIGRKRPTLDELPPYAKELFKKYGSGK